MRESVAKAVSDHIAPATPVSNPKFPLNNFVQRGKVEGIFLYQQCIYFLLPPF
jgi:hypothetical protein